MARVLQNEYEIAGRINAEHNHAEASLRAGLEHARKAGELLTEARRGEELASKSDTVSDLTMREALAVLASDGQAEVESARAALTRVCCTIVLPVAFALADGPWTQLRRA